MAQWTQILEEPWEATLTRRRPGRRPPRAGGEQARQTRGGGHAGEGQEEALEEAAVGRKVEGEISSG